MTFSQMTFRIFKVNFRRYFLYFSCSSFTIMIFHTFLSLYTNPDFQDPYRVNSMISGNLYAPLLVLVLFSVFFILYSQSAFLKFRKSEFGLFLALGMTIRQARWTILLENAMVAILSLLAGLTVGSAFSFLFFRVVKTIVDMDEISFRLSWNSYVLTIAFFGMLYLVVTVWNAFFAVRNSPIKLLKESRTADSPFLQRNTIGFAGILLLGEACWDMLSHYDVHHSNVILRSLVVGLLGLYLVLISSGEWLVLLYQVTPKSRLNNMLFCADIRYTFHQLRRVIFLTAILVSITIVLGSLTMYLTSNAESMAVKRNPYSIAYAEVSGKNAILPDKLQEIAKQTHTPISSIQRINYIDISSLKFLSATELSTLTGTEYQVEPSRFINLLLVDPHDGYVHETSSLASVDLPSASGKETFISEGTVNQFSINKIPFLGERFLILNESDFSELWQGQNSKRGFIHFLNFTDWKKTEEFDKSLNRALADYNQNNTQAWYETPQQEAVVFHTSSRIGDYLQNVQASRFLLFLMYLVGILFYAAAGVVLHFRVLTEMEKEKLKYSKLRRIGITSKEVARQVRQSFRLMFFLPYAIGILFGGFFTICIVYSLTGQLLIPTEIVIKVSACFITAQICYYLVYTTNYKRKMIDCLK